MFIKSLLVDNANQLTCVVCTAIIKGLPTTSEDLSVFVLFLLFKVCRLRRKTFLFLLCFLLFLLRFPTLVGNLSVFVLSFLIKVCRRTSEDLSVFVVFLIIIFIIKVCRRTSEDLSVFVVFLIIKVCRRTSEDLSVFVVFLIIFIILSYFSLQQIFSNGFSVIS